MVYELTVAKTTLQEQNSQRLGPLTHLFVLLSPNAHGFTAAPTISSLTSKSVAYLNGISGIYKIKSFIKPVLFLLRGDPKLFLVVFIISPHFF